MKKLSVFPLLAALAVFVSCQKQQTEEERKAEVERQVQERLAAEKAAADKDSLAKQQAELEAREKALADREAAAAVSPTPVVEETAAPPAEEVVTEQSDGEAPVEPQSTAAYGMFYEKLEPQGEWLETNQYGYVFQPREAETSRDWRPYTEGHWVYSDAGWTWISDEPFGWATYHYGRWVRLRRVGWVWVPGKQWAPAWVSWRSSKDYVGWAPLPPEARFDRRSGIQNWADSYYDIGPDQYSFVPSNEFGAEHVRRAVVPAERNINIVIETNNVTRITFSNTMIVNEGPSYDELRSRGPRPIERYRLRRERNTEATARISGNELQVSVPLLSEVRNIFRPRRVKERVTEVNVDNGWTEIKDRSAVERARTKIRTEATPPPNAPPKKFVPPTQTAPTAVASATPASTAAPAPTARATSSPAATVTSATPTPAASPTVRVRPSPSVRPTAAATATAGTSATSSPAVSATPRTRPSPSIPVRNSPAPLPSASVPMSSPPINPRRTAPPVLATPAATASPAAETQPSSKPLPTLTPAKRPPMPPRMVPSPSVAPETADTVRPPTPRAIPPRMTPRPVATPTVAPEKTEITTPPTPRDIPRRTIPPRMTPAPVATPPPPAPEKTETTTPLTPRDVPRRTPPPRMTPPRVATPTVAPKKTETTTPPTPRDIPRRTIPPRITPPPAATPSVAPSAPAVSEERAKNRRPPRPVPGATESGTPTPAPSTPPN
jgi:hypothetical protein